MHYRDKIGQAVAERLVAALPEFEGRVYRASQTETDPTDQQLLAYGWAPGGYTMRCPDCGERRWANDKRARVCRYCAEMAWHADREIASPGEIEALRAEKGTAHAAARQAIARRREDGPLAVDEPEKPTVAEWASDNIRLDKGPFEPTGYQRAFLDALSEPGVEVRCMPPPGKSWEMDILQALHVADLVAAGFKVVRYEPFAYLVQRAVAYQAQVAATPNEVPLAPCQDAEVQRLATLTPPELEAELVARGYSPAEAARVVSEAAAAALGKPVASPESRLPAVGSFES